MQDSLLLFDLIMAAMLLWAGGNAAYCAFRIQRACQLIDNRYLYPGNCKPELCQDVVGFILFIVPRLWVLGVICLLMGLATLVLRFTTWVTVPDWINYGLIPGIGVGAFLWYVTVQHRAAKKFW